MAPRIVAMEVRNTGNAPRFSLRLRRILLINDQVNSFIIDYFCDRDPKIIYRTLQLIGNPALSAPTITIVVDKKGKKNGPAKRKVKKKSKKKS